MRSAPRRPWQISRRTAAPAILSVAPRRKWSSWTEVPLYPPRVCDTIGFDLTQGPGGEQELYDETSKYIRDIYNKASTLNRSAARLAMAVFQRRLASSTYALKRSFERRAEKISAAIKAIEENGLEAVRKAQRDLQKKAENNELDLFASATADDDSGDGAEAVEAGETETLGALVTENLADLILERDRVHSLCQMAQDLLQTGRESKFDRLLDTMKDPRFADEKMLVFTEHRDTANYLTEQLERLGFAGRVAQLHGAMDYVERDRQVEFFRRSVEDGGAKYLIGTDAAGEGVNLQFCWLMVNYDVPWNPARLEQRMGRIHRYGQKHDRVYIANLVASKTREGKVMKTLLDKMETIRRELGSDKVFDVIGRLFENVSLKSYLDAAIRGEDAADGIEGLLTIEQVRALEAKERALYGTGGEVKARLPAMREDLERERYLRLMPGYVQRLVERSAPLLGLGIDGNVSSGFRFKVKQKGAMDSIAPEIETYPLEARQRLMVVRPASGRRPFGFIPASRYSTQSPATCWTASARRPCVARRSWTRTPRRRPCSTWLRSPSCDEAPTVMTCWSTAWSAFARRPMARSRNARSSGCSSSAARKTSSLGHIRLAASA